MSVLSTTLLLKPGLPKDLVFSTSIRSVVLWHRLRRVTLMLQHRLGERERRRSIARKTMEVRRAPLGFAERKLDLFIYLLRNKRNKTGRGNEVDSMIRGDDCLFLVNCV